jgi:hypothetical protein
MPGYVLEGWKWGDPVFGTPGGVVEWSFTSSSFAGQHYSFLSPHGDFHSDIRRAFDRWESVTNIDFQEVGDAFANDIRVGFASLDGAAGATLGECWQITWITTPVTPARMEIAFDDDEAWVWRNGQIVEEQSGVSFYSVALHEIGHAIGLDHYEGEGAVMNSFISASSGDLLPSDIAGVQALYGAKAGVLTDDSLNFTTTGTTGPTMPTTPTPSISGDVFQIASLKSKMSIGGFDPAADQIFLDDAKFKGLGDGSPDGSPFASSKCFVANTSGLATVKKGAQIIYETDTGKLWYDSDGKKGDAHAMHFATVTNKAALSISDFELF